MGVGPTVQLFSFQIHTGHNSEKKNTQGTNPKMFLIILKSFMVISHDHAAGA